METTGAVAEAGTTTAAAVGSRLSRFIGAADHAIDDKNRVTIPRTMSEPLRAHGAVLAVLDDVLVCWDGESFGLLVEDMHQDLAAGAFDRAALNAFLNACVRVVPDGQGRIVVPAHLRVAAGLDRDVQVRGCGPRIEIVAFDPEDLQGARSIDLDLIDAIERRHF